MTIPIPFPAREACRSPVILVVDDDELHRELHCMMLRRAGYHAEAADGGEEALRWIGDTRPALVLTDLRMPGLDGFAFVERLRREPRLTGIPVIMVTGDAPEVAPARAMAAGLSALLPKPVEMTDLLSAVAEALVAPPRAA
ncbi:MAG TPA: response regulator [Longimicrobium sp.]|jgi:CheY-like chemotaxis protein|uniref:response regulator n=1 Tax=Longimicrobium sp. TaxID=2029185 RepID=UPI002ED7A469